MMIHLMLSSFDPPFGIGYESITPKDGLDLAKISVEETERLIRNDGKILMKLPKESEDKTSKWHQIAELNWRKEIENYADR